MYILHTAVPAFGTRTASPFACKALSLMALSRLPFERRDVNPNAGPRKKIPYLTTPEGTVITDSHNIETHLRAHLPFGHTARDIAIRRISEEHLYFAQVHFRWSHHANEVRDAFFAAVPGLMRPLVFALVNRQVRGSLYGQGFGRRPTSEMLATVNDDLDALEHLLDARPFFGGDALSAADVSVHGLLEQLVPTTLEDPLIQAVRARHGLVALHRRVEDAIYGS